MLATHRQGRKGRPNDEGWSPACGTMQAADPLPCFHPASRCGTALQAGVGRASPRSTPQRRLSLEQPERRLLLLRHYGVEQRGGAIPAAEGQASLGARGA